MRTCKCGEEFEPTHPTMRKCKRCKREYDKAWRASRPEQIRLEAKNRRLKHLYGITLTEYEAMSSAQGGKCAICGSLGTETRQGRFSLAVDHCHETGRVRGLLCQDCNSGIGSLQDDSTLLEAAIRYLNGVSLTKYTKTESGAKVLTPQAHQKAQDALRKQGKSSAAHMTDTEREQFNHDLNQAE